MTVNNIATVAATISVDIVMDVMMIVWYAAARRSGNTVFARWVQVILDGMMTTKRTYDRNDNNLKTTNKG